MTCHNLIDVVARKPLKTQKRNSIVPFRFSSVPAKWKKVLCILFGVIYRENKQWTDNGKVPLLMRGNKIFPSCKPNDFPTPKKTQRGIKKVLYSAHLGRGSNSGRHTCWDEVHPIFGSIACGRRRSDLFIVGFFFRHSFDDAATSLGGSTHWLGHLWQKKAIGSG